MSSNTKKNYARISSSVLNEDLPFPVPVTVEAMVTPGIGIHMTGLCDAALKESLLRIVTALQSSGYGIPGKKMVINIAPSPMGTDTDTSGLDLAIALCIIAASGQEAVVTEGWTAFGRLGLDGSITKTEGQLCLLHDRKILDASTLKEAISILKTR